jgi:hypothetical protein
MKTTIKKIREMLDNGLICRDEVKGLVVNIGFLTLTVTDYEETPGDYLPNKWHLERAGKNYEFTPHHGLVAV